MRCARRARPGLLASAHRACGLLLVVALAAAPPAAAGVELAEVLAYVGFEPAETEARLRSGEILSRRFQEGEERTELAISVVGLFESTLDEARDWVVAGTIFEVDRQIVASRRLAAWPPDPTEFAGVGFGADQAAEVARLREFRGGSDLNLSAEEWSRFADLADRGAVSAAYRQVLLGRYRAYRERGLAGLAPYDRGSGRRLEPAVTLGLAARATRFLREHAPALHRMLTAFPDADSAAIEHFFYWFEQSVQGRPTFVLSHRMLTREPELLLLAERQYFIGHSYNTVQIVTGAIPVPEGIAVIYTSRTSIDQLAGLTGRVARPIAASRVAERVRERFQAIRARLRETR